ncbi:MAG: hypothetical protein JJ921_16085 [Pseudomonadales bacterium]|nr:hypothetical protein [Pseudomonadales bacterium]MBO7005713.1 hypothetical protein [Pseudomonadales bacterium]
MQNNRAGRIVLELFSDDEHKLLGTIREMIRRDDRVSRVSLDVTGGPVPTLHLETSWVELYRAWKGIAPELSELITLRMTLQRLSQRVLKFDVPGYDDIPLLELFTLSSDAQGQNLSGLDIRLSGYIDLVER